MARGPRIDLPGGWQHLMNRAAGRHVLFRDDGERRLFLELLSEVEARFGLEVHGYCLMGNHYHLLVRSADGRLSEAMQWLGARFTVQVNAARGVDGAIFRGRFHSVLIERDCHLVWLYRYINANPLDLGWRDRLAAYPWSGLAATLGESVDPEWLRTDFARSWFGEDARRLERFVEAAHAPRTRGPMTDSFDDVSRAAEIARGPGPYVNTDSEVRAATTVVALDVLGFGECDTPTISGLDTAARRTYLHRVRGRVQNGGRVEQLAERIVDLLVVQSEPSMFHLVSDTR